MSLLSATSRALAALAEQGVAGCLVGGLAVSARCDPRFTHDVDLVVAVESDGHAEAVVASLGRRGYSVQALVEQEAVGRLATVRLTDPDGLSIDLLFASSGIEREVVADAEALEIASGVRLPVARTGHLMAMKLLSVADGRETDAADLRWLARAADDTEWERAERSVRAIVERGFGRGRDLVAALAALHDQPE